MSHAETAGVWSALPIPALLLDRNNCLTSINPAAEEFLNAGQKSLVGRLLSECLVLEKEIEIARDVDRARKGQSVLFRHDVNVFKSESDPAICDIQIAPVNERSGAMLLLLQPRQIKGRLGRVLQAKATAKAAVGLADMLAHEIKNPLAGINGAAQLLEMNLGRKDQELTGLIMQETHRIVDLLKQVEQFGDLRPPRMDPLNVHDLLERARMSASVGSASSMQFSDQYDPSLPKITGDEDQLLQVFSNLFANAAEAADDNGGNIIIRTYYEYGLRLHIASGEWDVPLQIEVIDDGPGILSTIAEDIFEPFVSTRENGTGLGLALVSKIISEHNGTISVKSRPGKTIFKISLPVWTNSKS